MCWTSSPRRADRRETLRQERRKVRDGAGPGDRRALGMFVHRGECGTRCGPVRAAGRGLLRGAVHHTGAGVARTSSWEGSLRSLLSVPPAIHSQAGTGPSPKISEIRCQIGGVVFLGVPGGVGELWDGGRRGLRGPGQGRREPFRASRTGVCPARPAGEPPVVVGEDR